MEAAPNWLDEELLALIHANPHWLRLLFRLGLDPLGDVHRTLAEACRMAGLSHQQVLPHLQAAPLALSPSWERQSTAELLNHLATVHQRQREQLARLPALLLAARPRRRSRVTALSALAAHVGTMQEELTAHMAKEELILFPWLRSGRGRNAGVSVRIILTEHEATADLLRGLRGRVRALPPSTPASQALVDGLQAFMEDLVEHIHVENQVLFPRAMQ